MQSFEITILYLLLTHIKINTGIYPACDFLKPNIIFNYLNQLFLYITIDLASTCGRKENRKNTVKACN